MAEHERNELVAIQMDRYVFRDFAQGGDHCPKPPQCKADESLHPTLVEAQRWLEDQRALGRYCITLFMWSSNDACQKVCRGDLSWRLADYEKVTPKVKGYTDLTESPFYKNALEFKRIVTASSHMVVMVGAGQFRHLEA